VLAGAQRARRRTRSRALLRLGTTPSVRIEALQGQRHARVHGTPAQVHVLRHGHPRMAQLVGDEAGRRPTSIEQRRHGLTGGVRLNQSKSVPARTSRKAPWAIAAAVASCWNTLMGSSVDSTVTVVPSRIGCVEAAAALTIALGDDNGMVRVWCSPNPKKSRPTSSARWTASRISRSAWAVGP
jgi:hypothetical protein